MIHRKHPEIQEQDMLAVVENAANVPASVKIWEVLKSYGTPDFHELVQHAPNVALIKRIGQELTNLRSESRVRKVDTPLLASAASSHSRGTLLMKADVLAELNSEQKDELFSGLFMHRSELRLIVFDERGQISNEDAALHAIRQLPNVRFVSDPSYESAEKKYGIPNSPAVLFLPQGEGFKQAPDKRIKAVLLKKRVGEIEFARLLAMNGGTLPDFHDVAGVFDPSGDLLAALSRDQLASLVVAYAA